MNCFFRCILQVVVLGLVVELMVTGTTATAAADASSANRPHLRHARHRSLGKENTNESTDTVDNGVNSNDITRPDINYETAIANENCIIHLAALLQIPDAEETLPEEEVFECEMDPQDVGGYSGMIRTIALSSTQKSTMYRLLDDGTLNPSRSKLKLQGKNAIVTEEEVILPTGYSIEDNIEIINEPEDDESSNGGSSSNQYTNNSNDAMLNMSFDDPIRNRRHLQNGGVTGTKPILVVKVYDKDGRARIESSSQISDDIFGTNGDPVTLKSQLYDCSMEQLTVVPGVIPSDKQAATGVIEVTIGISLYNSRGDIRNAVTREVIDYLGIPSLPGQYEQVMYVLEGCYEGCGWAAYAYVNSWLSVYQGFFYKAVGVQVHELGHNFGFAHSGGLDGKTYTDHTGLMGNPLYSDDVGRSMYTVLCFQDSEPYQSHQNSVLLNSSPSHETVCYNAAKNYQISWYNDRKLLVEPLVKLSQSDSWSEAFLMVGIADYQNEETNNLPVVMKLETNTLQDYYVGFNRATGINADNDEADDEIVVIITGKNGESYSQSYLKATLKAGEEYIIEDFGGSGTDIAVLAMNIEESATTPWRANVWVGVDGMQPTPAPTKPRTESPTKGPSSSPIFEKTLFEAGNDGDPSSAFPLSECQGDCDEDDDCEGALVCFERAGDESVPGCSGDGTSRTDYCYNRSKYPNYTRYKGNDLESYGLCEGDCDNDDDCEGNLRCFQRDDLTQVPGCIGDGIESSDYCFGGSGRARADEASYRVFVQKNT